MCSPPRGWAALPPMFGQEGRYIMLEIKSPVFKKSPINVDSFVISAISDKATINCKEVYGTDGGFRRFHTLAGVLPTGELIGKITTYRDNGKKFEKFREVTFIVTAENECEFIGVSPLKAHRVPNTREINTILAACLDFGFDMPDINCHSMFKHTYGMIDLAKIFL